MDPVVAVQTALLRLRLPEPELLLRPGASIVARVASRAEQQGVIVLAGIPLSAQLPKEVAAGDTLRLTVAEVTPERVTLKLESAEAPHAAPQAAAQQHDPARVRVQEPPRRRPGQEEQASVALSFESSVLGRLDLRVELGAGVVRAGIATPAGPATALATANAEELRAALEARLDRPAAVRVQPRRDPLDVYA